jgi:hypothetical protein
VVKPNLARMLAEWLLVSEWFFLHLSPYEHFPTRKCRQMCKSGHLSFLAQPFGPRL